MNQLLQLKYDPSQEAQADAWFLPGDSVEHWLAELTRCGLAGLGTRLFVVPSSLENRAPAGLLVVPAHPESLAETPSGLACLRAAGRLFLPADAVLQPPATDAELRSVCPLPVNFFHPVFGLSAFEAEATLRVSDLLELPEERPDNWNFARAGAPALPELAGVALLMPPNFDDLFGDAQNEIGTEPPDDLPAFPDEPNESPASKAQRKLRQWFAKGVSETLRRLPHGGQRRTWVNDAEDWARQQLNTLNKADEQLRHKQLHRLLHMLDADPDQGLRHAIRMGHFAHRGQAPPSNRLGSHSLNFNPNRLGGGPADFWNIPPDLEATLRRRYREMADREMQLGRHRRAAYIYAELLGDLVSAANALRQGKHFQDAAVIYEEHLKNPLAAARCYAEGGFLAEAITRLEKLGRWLDIAELHERAGDSAAAEAAIRRAIKEKLDAGDIVGAAGLLEQRLQAHEEALKLLLDAWPSSRQAALCLGAAFQILSRLGRHDVALERLAQLWREPMLGSLVQPLVTTLSSIARDYTHEPVRLRAADLARVLISQELRRPSCNLEESSRLVDVLVRLAPHDRLLSRDANRFIARLRSQNLRTRKIAPPPIPGHKATVHRRFNLPAQNHWFQLRRESHWFFALGKTDHRLTMVRGVWEGHYQSLWWDSPGKASPEVLAFEPTNQFGTEVVLARPGARALPLKELPAADNFFHRKCVVGTPPWLPTGEFPFAFAQSVVWTMHLANGRGVLSCFEKQRTALLQTCDVTDDLVTGASRDETTRLALVALEDGVAVALGNRLVILQGKNAPLRVELPGQAVRLVHTLDGTRKGVAVMLAHGAVMYWLGADSCMELDRDLEWPLGAFIAGGPMVLASGSKLLLLEMDSRGIQSVARLEQKDQRIVGVTGADNPGQFATLTDSGLMTIYRMSE